MNKTIIVSNRLPVNLKIDNRQLQVETSVGGLATGMKSVHSEGNGIWIGWSGLTEEQLDAELTEKVDEALQKEKCATVSLTEKDVENFYFGFSNRTLWPMFHYFQEYTEFELEQWNSYKEVNRKFADEVLAYANEGDMIWVHDYQLMLLPQMIRDKNPALTIGFFLHIPYPSYEIFRTFPWREELLNGVLGANLVGFHTYDYVRHFLSSVKRIKGLETKFNDIVYDGRTVKVDSFPMGIDYNQFNNAAQEHKTRPEDKKSDLMRKLEEHSLHFGDNKLILSIDRMDYTKGIPNRILAFEYFLNKYPEYKEKVRLVMLAVPSRSNVPQYQKLKRETDELVGRINGQFATVNWTPIWYFYRSMPFEDLIDLYASSQVALVTPIRDGMNLVAKEYVASRADNDGVLVLSEMAGAAKELHEALLINPNNFEQIADTLKFALEMPPDEQSSRILQMKERISRYNVEKWSEEFMKALYSSAQEPEVQVTRELTTEVFAAMGNDYDSVQKRLFLLDYDGTLVGFKNTPAEAFPDDKLFDLLDSLAADENNEVVIISGRDHDTLGKWFGHKNYTLITDHGVWLRRKGRDWEAIERVKSDWKENIRPIMETFVDRTPGSFIEEKNYSLAWHYRKADGELADIRAKELEFVLNSLISNNSLAVLEGNKVLEIKNSNVNKGRAAGRLLAGAAYDFIFAIGDDWTDEYMFEELPVPAYTVKVGSAKTHARFYVKDNSTVRLILEGFAGSKTVQEQVYN